MGRMKKVQKTRTVTKNRWDNTTGSYIEEPVLETYWVNEYVSGSDSYGGSYDGGSSSSYDSGSYSSGGE